MRNIVEENRLPDHSKIHSVLDSDKVRDVKTDVVLVSDDVPADDLDNGVLEQLDVVLPDHDAVVRDVLTIRDSDLTGTAGGEIDGTDELEVEDLGLADCPREEGLEDRLQEGEVGPPEVEARGETAFVIIQS